jgi:hypothetical protein
VQRLTGKENTVVDRFAERAAIVAAAGRRDRPRTKNETFA